MTAPVDLTNLHEMTDNDTEMEKLLFAEFCTSFEKGIDALKNSFNETESETWRAEAHGLKGIALNLGAETLGMLCKKGQDDFKASAEAKNEIFKGIAAEYENVKQFLHSSGLL